MLRQLKIAALFFILGLGLGCATLKTEYPNRRSTGGEDPGRSLIDLEDALSRILAQDLGDAREISQFNVSPGGCWVAVATAAKYGIVEYAGADGERIFLVNACQGLTRSFRGRGMAWAASGDTLWAIDTSGRLVTFRGRTGSVRRGRVAGISLVVPGNFMVFGEVAPFTERTGLVLGYSKGFAGRTDRQIGNVLCAISNLRAQECSVVERATVPWDSVLSMDDQRVVATRWMGGARGDGKRWLEIVGFSGRLVKEEFSLRLPENVGFAALAPGAEEDQVFVTTVSRTGVSSPVFYVVDWKSQELRQLAAGVGACSSDYILGAPRIEAVRRIARAWEVLLEAPFEGGPRHFVVNDGGQVVCGPEGVG